MYREASPPPRCQPLEMRSCSSCSVRSEPAGSALPPKSPVGAEADDLGALGLPSPSFAAWEKDAPNDTTPSPEMSIPSGITVAITAMVMVRAIKVTRDFWSGVLDISCSFQWIRSAPGANPRGTTMSLDSQKSGPVYSFGLDNSSAIRRNSSTSASSAFRWSRYCVAVCRTSGFSPSRRKSDIWNSFKLTLHTNSTGA